MTALKIAVAAVTVLLLGSFIALYRGNLRLHGRINIVFFILTLAALVGLEVITNIVSPGLLEQFLAGRAKLLNLRLQRFSNLLRLPRHRTPHRLRAHLQILHQFLF